MKNAPIYTAPEADLLLFLKEDVICASSGTPADGTENPPAGGSQGGFENIGEWDPL